jgi:MFS family permease
VLLAAGPLLVASITTDPLAVAMAFFAQRLPWFLFGLFAGAIVDRVDRRMLVMAVDLLRAAILSILAATIALELVNLTVIYGVMFLLGTAETVADNASSSLVPVAVPKEGLGTANARLYGTMMVTNQLAGPPIGAFLFGVGALYPFGFNAICFAVAVAIVAKIELPPRVDLAEAKPSVRQEVIEGLRWLWTNPPVRTLAIMITAFNITFGAAFSIWVLYARENLGLSELGYGLLLAAFAVGGVIGSAAYGSLERRFAYATLLRVGLIIETLTHLALALTRSPYFAAVVIATFGAHAIVWGTTSTTVRQRAVPDALLGRVTSVYLIGGVGALALGALLGGAIAGRWGILAPFWFAFAGSILILSLTWRSIAYVARAADTEEVPASRA